MPNGSHIPPASASASHFTDSRARQDADVPVYPAQGIFTGITPKPLPSAPVPTTFQTVKTMYDPRSTVVPLYNVEVCETSAVNRNSPLFKSLPTGLQKAMEAHAGNTAYAFRVLDNSASMDYPDGNILNQGTGEVSTVRRYDELKDAELEQAKLASTFGIPTQFRLLNIVDDDIGRQVDVKSEADIQQVRKLLKDKPKGSTPLNEHLDDIAQQIKTQIGSQKPYRGPKFTVALITDGVPYNGGIDRYLDQDQFIQSLRSLLRLPVNVVIRLCTDQKDVVNFYDELDGVLEDGAHSNGFNNNAELDLDVIDDHLGEANQIHKHNPWINYGRPLHMVRTAGLPQKLFDYIDERPLIAEEAKEFCELVYGLNELPNPKDDWKGFSKRLKQAIKEQPKTTDPLRRKKEEPFVSIKKLKKEFGPRWFF